MTTEEFVGWPKMTRFDPTIATVTEKINGTNAAVRIRSGELVTAQSRNRFITPDDDNFGFAGWCRDNSEELVKLGDGLHFGEWAGPGIQGNPHGFGEKTFLLFNVGRWCHWRDTPAGGSVFHNADLPKCVTTVPVMAWEVAVTSEVLAGLLESLKERGGYAEGMVVYNHAFRQSTKHTIESPNGKWCKE